ncbi:hypothetical protein [Staphylococcus equorum]|uniref:hypothetical protein n=1 Tax=Staphylococcus equorum TaxID=246432 RepID=UPI000D1C62B8|nr:hypothetical protein [Staphylococcus equorum]MDK9848061.1 hypothetical protein [Staphylococcus equorum]PTE30945.1 hypothetical protein BUY83_04405 [Staphylococcus equorum]RIM06035.1 hypothetical protein BUY80_03545 [Staphylococcus equorum]
MLRSMSSLFIKEQNNEAIDEVAVSLSKRLSIDSKVLYKGVIKVFEKLYSKITYSGKLKNAQ